MDASNKSIKMTKHDEKLIAFTFCFAGAVLCILIALVQQLIK